MNVVRIFKVEYSSAVRVFLLNLINSRIVSGIISSPIIPLSAAKLAILLSYTPVMDRHYW